MPAELLNAAAMRSCWKKKALIISCTPVPLNSNKTKYIKKGKNIHQHLDLIAGLPFEDKESFDKADTSQIEILETYPEQFGYLFRVGIEKTDGMFRELSKHKIKLIKEIQYSLEKYFLENVVGGINYESERTNDNE